MPRKGSRRKNHADATTLAMEAIASCTMKEGIVAGRHHFVDLWARDSLFATFGANVAELSDVSRKTIETFFKFQRPDGLVPFLIRRSKLTICKYFGKHTYYNTPRPQFRSSQSGGTVLDGGLMTLIATAEYLRRTKDTKFLRDHFNQLTRAIAWYEKRFGSGLLSEWFQCEWADGVLKRGKVLYTNVLYYRALTDMAYMASVRKKPAPKARFSARALYIKRRIHDVFWNGIYFSDWADYKRQDYFSSGSNMLAVIFGIADRAQVHSIFSFAERYCWNTFTFESNYPKYPWWRIPIQNHVAGMADYHNRGCLWLQPGILYALALTKTGNISEGREVLSRIAEKIVEHGGVYEVYEKNGRPLRRRWYQAEQPFAWSAGLFLWAYSILREP